MNEEVDVQDRYVGDIGDFSKLALLRRLTVGHSLGVLWWLYPNEAHNADGRHIDYLARPDRWRPRDPVLFDGLAQIVASGRRNVGAIRDAGLLNGSVLFEEPVPIPPSFKDRGPARAAWFERGKAAVEKCDLVFIDPDNGLETASFSVGQRTSGKSVTLDELDDLGRRGRTLVVYHHQTRMAGGHFNELRYWGQRLGARGFTVGALRASAHSSRAYFLLNADEQLHQRCEALTAGWDGKLSWHPDLHRV